MSGLSGASRTILGPIIHDPDFEGVVQAGTAAALLAESGETVENLMISLLPIAAAYARPPISEFRVGALSRGESGNLYFGANLEFPGLALTQTVHAEQSATMNAWLHDEAGITSLAVNFPPYFSRLGHSPGEGEVFGAGRRVTTRVVVRQDQVRSAAIPRNCPLSS